MKNEDVAEQGGSEVFWKYQLLNDGVRGTGWMPTLQAFPKQVLCFAILLWHVDLTVNWKVEGK